MSRHPVTPMHEADLRVHLVAAGPRATSASCDVPLARARRRLPRGARRLRRARRRRVGAARRAARRRRQPAQLETIGARDPQARATRAAARGRRQQRRAGADRARGACRARRATARSRRRAGRSSSSRAACRRSRRARSATATLYDACRSTRGRSPPTTRLPRDEAARIVDRLQCGPSRARAHDAGRARSLVAARRGVGAGRAGVGGAAARRCCGHATLERVGIAGGDTSSHAVQALGAWGLEWMGRIDAGVPLLRARADAPAVDGLELMLKGGQMGGDELFDVLVRGSAAPAS